MVKVAYTVGRFQPPTIGHRMLIQAVKTAAGPGGKAYVFVSAVGPDSDKNPLTAEMKLPLLKHMFPDVEFVHTKRDCKGYKNCGGPGLAFAWLTDKENGPGHEPADIAIVLGKERLGDSKSKEYFGKGARIWGGDDKPVPSEFIPVGHTLKRDIKAPSNDEANMSGTKARSYVQKDNSEKKDFYTAVGYDPNTVAPEVEAVYDRIYEAKFGATKGGNDDTEAIATDGPDGEPKVTRTVRSTRKARASRRSRRKATTRRSRRG